MIEERDGLAATLHTKQREMETMGLQMSEDAQRSLARMREKDQKILDWEEKNSDLEAKIRMLDKQVCLHEWSVCMTVSVLHACVCLHVCVCLHA